MKIIKSKIEMAETHSIRENGCHKSHFIDFSTFGTCLLCACIFACVGVNSRAKNCSLTQSCIVIHRRWASFRFQHSTPNSRFSSSQPKHNPQLFQNIIHIIFHYSHFIEKMAIMVFKTSEYSCLLKKCVIFFYILIFFFYVTIVCVFFNFQFQSVRPTMSQWNTHHHQKAIAKTSQEARSQEANAKHLEKIAQNFRKLD